MTPEAFPALLKQWRMSRRLSQEALAFEAEVSTRHLSFLETGKSRPSREMVLILASALDLELRERNLLLGSAGFAPVYTSSALESLALEPVRRAIDLLMERQEPYGALLLDRCWNVLRANRGATRLLSLFLGPGVEPRVAANAVRATLHPQGMRACVVNWPELARVILERVERECAAYPSDQERQALLAEVRTYPDVAGLGRSSPASGQPMAQVHLRRGSDEVRLFTMLTTLGTPLDVTAQELTIESYFPADEASERWLRGDG